MKVERVAPRSVNYHMTSPVHWDLREVRLLSSVHSGLGADSHLLYSGATPIIFNFKSTVTVEKYSL